MEKFDVTVIGGGPGGYPAAIRAAQIGASVALVEKGPLGGTCLNWGCIPTKALIASSTAYFAALNGAFLGLSVQEASVDYGKAVDHKDKSVSKLGGGVAALLKANGVKVIKGGASFSAHGRIDVDCKPAIDSRKTIIATGSEPVKPGFVPDHSKVVDSRGFLDLRKLPKSLIVLGGGVIGCEFACMAAQFGVKVTVVEMLDDILSVFDGDIVSVLRRNMEKELNIRLLTGKPLENIKADSGGVRGMFGEERVEADMMLSAIGRRPYTDGLNLGSAGLETDEKGQIPIDRHCRTSSPGIYAVGDVTAGSTQLAHDATAQGIVAAENACGCKTGEKEQVVPSCIFTSPEIGSVGLSETQAAQGGREIVTGKFMFSGLGKAIVTGETEGFVKWVCDAETGQALGGHAVGAHATELVAEAAMAVRTEQTFREVGRVIHSHPTFSEAWMEAAHAVESESIHQPPRRKKI